MPRIVEPINAIADRLGRRVLMVAFGAGSYVGEFMSCGSEYDWKADGDRRRVLEALDRYGIRYSECFPCLGPNTVLYPYEGHVFVELPDDQNDEAYVWFVSLLEGTDGTPRDPNITIWIVPPRSERRRH